MIWASAFRTATWVVVVALAAVLLQTVQGAPPAAAYVKLDCGRFTGTNPTINYYFEWSVGSARKTATRNGAGRWNAQTGLPGNFVEISTSTGYEIYVMEWSTVLTYEAQWDSQCSGSYWASNRGTMRWNSPSPGGLGSNATALRAIAVHEMGHALGLGHTGISCATPPPASVMRTGVAFWSCGWGTEPYADDRNGVNAIY